MTFKNAISWFEIPAIDLDRAQKFYETIFDIQMISMDMPQLKMRLFPIDDPMNIGGAICSSGDFYKPSAENGPLVYLNGNPDVQLILDKIKSAGGQVLDPKNTNLARAWLHGSIFGYGRKPRCPAFGAADPVN